MPAACAAAHGDRADHEVRAPARVRDAEAPDRHGALHGRARAPVVPKSSPERRRRRPGRGGPASLPSTVNWSVVGCQAAAGEREGVEAGRAADHAMGRRRVADVARRAGRGRPSGPSAGTARPGRQRGGEVARGRGAARCRGPPSARAVGVRRDRQRAVGVLDRVRRVALAAGDRTRDRANVIRPPSANAASWARASLAMRLPDLRSPWRATRTPRRRAARGRRRRPRRERRAPVEAELELEARGVLVPVREAGGGIDGPGGGEARAGRGGGHRRASAASIAMSVTRAIRARARGAAGPRAERCWTPGDSLPRSTTETVQPIVLAHQRPYDRRACGVRCGTLQQLARGRRSARTPRSGIQDVGCAARCCRIRVRDRNITITAGRERPMRRAARRGR